MKYVSKYCLLFFLITAHLEGCVFVAGAAAGAAAIAVVYDHRTITNTLKDTRIANRVSRKIGVLLMGHRDESHIEVTVFNGIVLLTGETPTQALRQQAEEAAISSPGIKRVYNQITIQGPTSTLTRTSDSWITTKVKSKMLATENLKSGSIKVVTENGVVYLMGLVHRKQADVAVEIARRISGVQKVVKIFQYAD